MQGVIVVAESSRTVRKMVEFALACHPFQLEFAGDGNAALRAVERCSPKLVLVDINLPGLNGYEVAAKIQGIPVILLAGRNYHLDMDKARDARVTGHVVTPFLTQKLVEVVFKALGMPVPDANLFRASALNIPLAANKGVAPLPGAGAAQLSPTPAPQPAAQLSPTPAPHAAQAPVTPLRGGARPAPAPTPAARQPMPPLRSAPPAPTLTTAKGSSPVRPASAAPVSERPATARPVSSRPSAAPVVAQPASRPAQPASRPVQTAAPIQSATPAAPMRTALPVTAPMMDDMPSLPQRGGPMDAALKSAVGSVTEQAIAQSALKGVSRDLVEAIAWEVVPKLAEAILKEEIARLVRAKLA